MTLLNSNNEQTVWWQTTLHVILFPVIFIFGVFLFGAIMVVTGQSFEGIFSFIPRFFQHIAATYAGLIVPTLFLKKSNELVASVVAGTILLTVTIVMFVVVEYIIGPKHDIREWLEMAGALAGIFVGVAIYYSGER